MAQTNVQVIITAKDNATKVIKGVGKSIKDFSKITKADMKQAGLMMAGVSASILMVGKSAISIASDLEQNRIAFETMTGSAEEAGKLLEKLSDFAVKTPFDMPGVIAAGKQLMAMGSGINDVIPDLKMLGDVAAGLGVPLQRLILNFGQVRMQGKLTGRELRDFAVLGVPLIDQLASSLGVAKEQIAEMVSAGEIGFDEVKKAFQDLSGEGGRFNNLMIRQSESLQGVISNTRDELIRFAAEVVGISTSGEIREGSLFAVLKDVAEKLLEAVEKLRPKVTEFVNTLAENRVALMALGGALLGLLIAPLVIATVLMAKAIIIAGAVVTAFAALGAAVAYLGKLWSENFLGIQEKTRAFAEFFKTTWEIIKTVAEALAKFFSEVIAPAFETYFDRLKAAIEYHIAIWQFAWAVIKTITEPVVKWFMSYVAPQLKWAFELVMDGLRLLWETFKVNFDMISGEARKLWDAIRQAFDRIKEKVESVINFISNLISSFKPKIEIGLDLPDIEGAWRNLKEKARVLGIPGFQTGGIVPGPIGAPVPIIAHAGEKITPAGVSQGVGGGGGVTFNVSVGLYAGTETEKRNIARELYASLVQVAKSQDKTVQEFFRG